MFLGGVVLTLSLSVCVIIKLFSFHFSAFEPTFLLCGTCAQTDVCSCSPGYPLSSVPDQWSPLTALLFFFLFPTSVFHFSFFSFSLFGKYCLHVSAFTLYIYVYISYLVPKNPCAHPHRYTCLNTYTYNSKIISISLRQTLWPPPPRFFFITFAFSPSVFYFFVDMIHSYSPSCFVLCLCVGLPNCISL